jgi:SAM-dependent methyltransferase
MPDVLTIPEHEIRRHGPGRIIAVCWRQWRTERHLTRRGVHFRDTDPDRVAAAYAAMSPDEFSAINGPQEWANWRTIPRALSGHVPQRPLRVLDLGCGTGSSTRVLAFYCPVGSHITGYEFAQPLLAVARRRDYRDGDGKPAQVDFVCQGVTEPLRQVDNSHVPAESVDLASASGIVGHHLGADTVRPLVDELCRVLKLHGIAMLDPGPTMPRATLRTILASAGFAFLGRYRSWLGDWTGQMVFRLGPAIRGTPEAENHGWHG